jgi:hypothetical protein
MNSFILPIHEFRITISVTRKKERKKYFDLHKEF